MAFEAVGVRAVIEGLSAFSRDARIVNQRLREVTQGIKDTSQEAKQAAKGFDDLGSELAIVGAGFAAVGAASGALLFSSVRLAARVETLGVVTATLGKNVGKTEQEIRDLEKAVQDQGITLQASRQGIALMIQSNIDLSHATDLAREAQNAGVIGNINSSEAFERLVNVITSGNVLMARNLGLQVRFETAYKATADALGTTTEKLTETDRVQARTNAVLAAGVNIADAYANAMETAGKQLTSLPRFTEQASLAIGNQFVPAFGAAIDVVTDLLVAFNELDPRRQNLIGSFVLLTATTGTTVGALSLATAGALKLAPAFAKLAAAAGLSAGALGLVALALGAVVAAGIAFINFNADVQRKQKALTEVVSDHTEALIRSGAGYEAYSAEVDRVNKLIEEQGVLGRLLARDLGDKLTPAEFAAAEEALRLQDAQGGVADATDDATRAVNEAADEFTAMAEAEAEAARQAEILKRNEEFLGQLLDDLQLGISTDVTKQFEDFQGNLADLNQQIADLETERLEALAEFDIEKAENLADLQERLGDLQSDLQIAQLRLKELGQGASEATRRAAEVRVENAQQALERLGETASEAQRRSAEAALEIAQLRLAELDTGGSEASLLAARERVAELRTEISDTQTEIAGFAEGNAASLAELEATYAEKLGAARGEIDETTKAWERQTAEIIFNLATQRLGIGGFTREELAALTALAGPDGLGLVDEAGVALIKKVDELALAMEATGDQSGFFAEDMGTLAQIMLDPTKNAEDLAAAIRDISSAVEESFVTPRFATDPFAQLFGQQRQFGGPVRRGQPTMVGERGQEMFVPSQSGSIVSNRMLTAISSMARTVASAFPIAMPSGFAGTGAEATTNNSFSQTINTSAPVEPVAADFRLLALMGERRG